jgi:predicted nuclease with TOPRIM domain
LWHSQDKYRRTVWQCNRKFQNEHKCSTPHLYEAELQKAFVDAFNSLIYNKEDILRIHEEITEDLTDTADLDREYNRLQSEYEEIVQLMKECVQENANTAIDQADYQRRYGPLLERYEKVKDSLARLADRRQERAAKREIIMRFLDILNQSELLTEFDEELWRTVVDTVMVRSSHKIIFALKDGTELSWVI